MRAPPPPPPKPAAEKAAGPIRAIWTPCLVRLPTHEVGFSYDKDGDLIVSYVDTTKDPQWVSSKQAKELERLRGSEVLPGPHYTVWVADTNPAFRQVWGGYIIPGKVARTGNSRALVRFLPGVDPLYTPPKKRSRVPPPPPKAERELSRITKGAARLPPPPPRKKSRKRPPPPPTRG